MDGEHIYGLSDKNRNYIVGVVFLALLIFGPVQPYGMGVRTAYLVAIPVGLWFILRFVADILDMDARTNDRLNRAITAAIAGILTVAAYQAATATHHGECTQTVRDGQGGQECVGDIVTVAGPDFVMSFIFTGLALMTFWLAVARKSTD